ncbi:hypothetical protein HAD_13484 [Hyphomonas adhaerens MHS-3]|uniref:Uncharacterized protein n=1 Tax=Hyphomonas adhaerens MHS-3 TaxID=1280949 RepID=A0A069E7J7_9PROT|nr:hypothetical protein HAD_13484 [Hyphomonas adhaerens MHS-3]
MIILPIRICLLQAIEVLRFFKPMKIIVGFYPDALREFENGFTCTFGTRDSHTVRHNAMIGI